MLKITVGLVYFSDNEIHCLDVGYAVSALKRIDNDLAIYKIDIENIDAEVEKIKEEMIVVFLSYNCYQLLLQVSSSVKKGNSESLIVVCGQLASKLYKEILTEIRYVDIVVIGEYEETLFELRYFFSLANKQLDLCEGIAYLKNNEIFISPKRKLMDINEIPLPDRDFMLNTRYFHMYGSRGCEAYCTFCDRKALYSNTDICVRMRSVKNIMEEIDGLV